jgi:hypothetical protein
VGIGEVDVRIRVPGIAVRVFCSGMLVMRSASELEVRKLVGSAVAERDAVMHDEVRGRTADAANQANVGVYAAVIAGGTTRRGDPVTLE